MRKTPLQKTKSNQSNYCAFTASPITPQCCMSALQKSKRRSMILKIRELALESQMTTIGEKAVVDVRDRNNKSLTSVIGPKRTHSLQNRRPIDERQVWTNLWLKMSRRAPGRCRSIFIECGIDFFAQPFFQCSGRKSGDAFDFSCHVRLV